MADLLMLHTMSSSVPTRAAPQRKFLPTAGRGRQKPAPSIQQNAVGRPLENQGDPKSAGLNAPKSQANAAPAAADRPLQEKAQVWEPAATQANDTAPALEQHAAVPSNAPGTLPSSQIQPSEPREPGPTPAVPMSSAPVLGRTPVSAEAVASPLPDLQAQMDEHESRVLDRPSGPAATPAATLQRLFPAPKPPSLVPVGAQDQPPGASRVPPHPHVGDETGTVAGAREAEADRGASSNPTRLSGKGPGRSSQKTVKEGVKKKPILQIQPDMPLRQIVGVIQAKERRHVQEERELKKKATRLALEAMDGGATTGSLGNALPPPPPRSRFGGSAAQVPRLAVQWVDGRLVEVETPAMLGEDYEEEGRTVAHDPIYVNSSSFSKKGVAKLWSPRETALFYKAFRVCGKDFGMMALFFPGRDRRQLLNKYKSETSKHPVIMENLENSHQHGDRKEYAQILEKAALALQEYNSLDESEQAAIDAPAAAILEEVEIADMPLLPETPVKGRKRKAGTVSPGNAEANSAKGRRISAPQPEIAGYLELPSWGQANKRRRRASIARRDPKRLPDSDSDSEWSGELEAAAPPLEPRRDGLRPRSTRAAARR